MATTHTTAGKHRHEETDTRAKHEQEQVVRAGPTLATGVIAGFAGGIGFGVLMQNEGMLPVVASLVGGRTASLGWVVHLAIAVFVGVSFAIIGISFAIFFARAATGFLSSTLFGLLYGAFWWVLGGLLLMPVWLGMKAFVIDEMAWKSLVGHLIYGALLGAVYGLVSPLLSRRRT
ncbi:MAG TPA: hypothetical protein VFC19_27775 [Candidatus Limnocylindrales bacterium]|nr:hypothetical protein [Candidatus Limnocylindrales bacterium]